MFNLNEAFDRLRNKVESVLIVVKSINLSSEIEEQTAALLEVSRAKNDYRNVKSRYKQIKKKPDWNRSTKVGS